MKQSAILLTSISIAFFAVLLFLPETAYAAPGGLIKEAAKTTWGKVIFALTLLFFLPLIVVYSMKRALWLRRTRRALERLETVDPRYDSLRLKEAVTQVFHWVYSAWDQKKMTLAANYVTPWYMENQQLLLDKWQRDGVENIFSDVRLKEIRPLYVCRDKENSGRDRIVFEIDAELRDYLVEKATGNVVQGDKTLGELCSVWHFAWQEDRWVLTMIEEAGTALGYLKKHDTIMFSPAELNP